MTSSRVGTQTNLQTGGTYDLLLVKFSGAYPEGQLTFGLYDTPMKITGIQKVAQQFLRTLLTTKGSDPFYPAKGTNMPSLMVGSNISKDNSLLISDISESVKDASQQTRSMLNVNTEDLESSLDRVEVIGIDTIDEGWFVALNLLTLAGEGVEIAVPFPEFGLSEKTTVSVPAPVKTSVRSTFSGSYQIATPYTVFELTSYLYPVETEDSISMSSGFRGGSLTSWVAFPEEVKAFSNFVSGDLLGTLLTYDTGSPEGVQGNSSFHSGSLDNALLSYNEGAEERISSLSSFVSGSLVRTLIVYNNSLEEEIKTTSSFVSGALT